MKINDAYVANKHPLTWAKAQGECTCVSTLHGLDTSLRAYVASYTSQFRLRSILKSIISITYSVRDCMKVFCIKFRENLRLISIQFKVEIKSI